MDARISEIRVYTGRNVDASLITYAVTLIRSHYHADTTPYAHEVVDGAETASYQLIYRLGDDDTGTIAVYGKVQPLEWLDDTRRPHVSRITINNDVVAARVASALDGLLGDGWRDDESVRFFGLLEAATRRVMLDLGYHFERVALPDRRPLITNADGLGGDDLLHVLAANAPAWTLYGTDAINTLARRSIVEAVAQSIYYDLPMPARYVIDRLTA